MIPHVHLLFHLFILLFSLHHCHAQILGGELATFTTPQMSYDENYRQNVCDRYQRFVDGEVELKDALEGMQVHTLIGGYAGAYFNYDEISGIDPKNPGMTAIIMDEVAKRGKFTWRQSFGVLRDPTNETWTEMLHWGTETFDVCADWWAQNLERLNMGVAFMKPWYDSSVILIKKEAPPVMNTGINWWNWLRPYEPSVWYLTLGTIILSGLVYQWLELLADERQDRSLWEWTQQNAYLSLINFTQAYEYRPKTLAGRIFGVSMAIWALVMTATYTANLASLLVDRQAPLVEVMTVAEAAVFGRSICTIEDYYSDVYIAEEYPTVRRVPQRNLEELYKALRRGDCDFATETVASWEKNKGMRQYNPTCDLEWVAGEHNVKVQASNAGFATKADAGSYCSGLIRDVINFHMEHLIAEGELAYAWEQDNRRAMDIDCAIFQPGELVEKAQELEVDLEEVEEDIAEDPLIRHRQRTLMRRKRQRHQPRRQLKSNTKGAAGGAVASFGSEGEGDNAKLTLNQMLGTFAFHWLMMAIALGIGHFNFFHDRYVKKHTIMAAELAAKKISVVGDQMADSLGINVAAKQTVKTINRVGDKMADSLGISSIRRGSSIQEEVSSIRRRSSDQEDCTYRDEPLEGDEYNNTSNSSTTDPAGAYGYSTKNPRPKRSTPSRASSSGSTADDTVSYSNYTNHTTTEPTQNSSLMRDLKQEMVAMREGHQEEMKAMREALLESQRAMQDMQRQMMVEQWNLQTQFAKFQMWASSSSSLSFPSRVDSPYATAEKMA